MQYIILQNEMLKLFTTSIANINHFVKFPPGSGVCERSERF